MANVLSYGCFGKAEFLFEVLTDHFEDDSFMFILSHEQEKFRIYIYSDYTYMVDFVSRNFFEEIPWMSGEYRRLRIDEIETFVETFMHFCQFTVKKEYIYFRERKIDHYMLHKFKAYFVDWNIWYAFFSLPYRMIKKDGDGNLFEHVQIAHRDTE
ncbi:Hypothetical predicted protein [Paramuricea clavata]|uniref:Uncharacterized protein n=1 Tax=Paramuricea clavata TaxID=317549 RepID=A0A7D9JFF4_PARCT|nr:Hypothetical predicted protein [Paramuricea clavata]